MSELLSGQSQQQLKRVLGLRELIICGIIMIQPTAPMPLFGVVAQEARGHVVTTILLGMVAMLFTAVSYGRMARAYPSAGSAYTYVGKELHPTLGFITGWSMLSDYVLNPIICVIWCSKAAGNFLPVIPYPVWAILFVVVFTALNLRGIEASARTNTWLATGMGIVIVVFLVTAVHYLWGRGGLTSSSLIQPFYDPATFSWKHVSTGTSLAVLTYIGFDGISTLAEEAKTPEKNILLATVYVCLLIGILSAIEVYPAQLIWPDFAHFPDIDTAFVYVAGRAGGVALFFTVNLVLLIANMGSGIGAHMAAARLMFGMGRDQALPARFFGAVSSGSGIPRNNVLLVGALMIPGVFLLSYEAGAELLNFGAFVGFMGVNMASFVRYWVRSGQRKWTHALPPLIGFAVCFYIWWNLSTPAKWMGLAWITLGLSYCLWKKGRLRDGTNVNHAEL
jgi:putrescine importer